MNLFIDRNITGRFLIVFLAIGLFPGNPLNRLNAQQEEEPTAEKPAAEKPADDAAKPKLDAPRTRGKAADAPAVKAEKLPSDPSVAALLAANPTTPSECAKTAKILADINEPARAREFLKKISDANLDRSQLAALGRELGSSAFLAFSQRAALQPEGKQLGDAVLDAMNAEYQDPEKIAAALKQLQDPSIEKRTEALLDLQNAGNAGIAALIEVLADPKRDDEFKYARAALAAMGKTAVNPLIGVLDGADQNLQTKALVVLGDSKASEAKLFLMKPYFASDSDDKLRDAAEKALKQIVGRVPNREEAVKLLLDNAKNYFNRNQPLAGVIDGQVEVWTFDPEKKICNISLIPAEDAARFLACRLAMEASSIALGNVEAHRLFVATVLEKNAYVNGLDKPLDLDQTMTLLGYGPSHSKELQDLLGYAIATRHYPAATATARFLGSSGKAGELLYPQQGQSLLIQAVEQPDRRLRMAAIQAIVKLKPEKPYPGSSNVTGALAFFASGTGTRRALVAGPNLNKIPMLIPALSAAGFKVETVNTGKEVMQKLLGSPDFEVAMIDAGISNPPIEMLVQQIRRDDRSADVRVGVVAREGFFEKAERAAVNDPLTLDFPRPNDAAAARWEVEQLTALKPRDLVRPEERLRQAGEALDILVELSASPKLYDIRRIQDSLIKALNVPALAVKAVAALAKINSPEAQQALVEIASRDSSPMELRQAAVEGFRANVEAHGILLKTDEILRQYDLYNRSKNADEASRKILGLLLDCLEAPSGKKS